jgi:branched-chain amino acid transport system permease protein
MRRVLQVGALTLLVIGLVLLPRVSPFFLVFVATEILIMGLFATGFNVLFGYCGLLSFGHAAFFGVGAYAAALLLQDLRWDFVWILLAAPALAGLAAALIGWLCVRLNEVYFAMLTLAFGMMVFAIVHQWRSVTGGSDGIVGFPLTSLGIGIDISLGNPYHFYYLTLFVVGFSFFFIHRITISPFGLLLRAMRDNTERVSFTGIPVYRYRLYGFVLSGVFSGLAGALFATFSRIAAPAMVHWTKSAEPVLMTVLGGSQFFFGPLVGSAVFLGLRTLITSYTSEWMIYLGGILLVMVLFLPRGILGLLERWLGGRT